MIKFDLNLKLFFILLILMCVFSLPTCAKKPSCADYRLEYINIDWWRQFEDESLIRYILKALENNNDAKIAALKSEEYNYLARISLGNELPHFGLSGTYSGIKFPQVNAVFKSGTNNIFAVLPVMNYEADFFLKNRDKTRAVKKEYEAQKHKEKAAYISLVSSVANAYFNIVSLDEKIRISELYLKNQGEIHRRTQNKFEAGTAGAVELNKSAQAYEEAKIALNDLEKARAFLINEFCVLIGENPCAGCEIERISFDRLQFKGKIPSSIPSDIVFSRPDVESTAAVLEKAKIDIRVARKDFLPSFNIIGAIGFTYASQYSGFFNWNNVLGLIAANAYQSLYQGGIKSATLKLRKNQYEQVFEQYKKNDLTALQEINDALCALKQDKKSLEDNFSRYSLEKNNLKRAQNTYYNGLMAYPAYLGQYQNLLMAQQDFTTSKTQVFNDYISLYKSVGAKL